MISCYCGGSGEDDDDDDDDDGNNDDDDIGSTNINADDLEEERAEKLQRGPTIYGELLGQEKKIWLLVPRNW